MNCPRCQSEMSSGRFVRDNVESVPWVYEGWHCLLCGTFIDSVILLNRPRPASQPLPKEEVIEFYPPEVTRSAQPSLQTTQ